MICESYWIDAKVHCDLNYRSIDMENRVAYARVSCFRFLSQLGSLLTLLIIGCAEGPIKPFSEYNGQANISLQIPLQLQGILEEVKIRVVAVDMDTITQSLIIQDSIAKGVLYNIPAGRDRIFIVDLFETGGHHAYTGSDTTDIEPGSITDLHISLLPVSGTVIITINLPEVELFSEDFESYATGSFPSPPWIPDANAVTNSLINTIIFDPNYSANKVLRIYGTRPGNWAALVFHPVGFSERFEVTCKIYFLDWFIDSLPDGYIHMRQGTSWTNPKRTLLNFTNSQQIHVGGQQVSANFNYNTWYSVKIKYERSSSRVTILAWINDIYLGEYVEDNVNVYQELSFDHFGFDHHGGAYIDDIFITKLNY